MVGNNLFAICEENKDRFVKRVQLNRTVQGEIVSLFNAQEKTFLDGITEEIDFYGNGGYDAENNNELLTIEMPEGAVKLKNAIQSNLPSILSLDTSNLNEQNIKALFMGDIINNDCIIFSSKIHSWPIFYREKFSILMENNVFQKNFRTLLFLEYFVGVRGYGREGKI